MSKDKLWKFFVFDKVMFRVPYPHCYYIKGYYRAELQCNETCECHENECMRERLGHLLRLDNDVLKEKFENCDPDDQDLQEFTCKDFFRALVKFDLNVSFA